MLDFLSYSALLRAIDARYLLYFSELATKNAPMLSQFNVTAFRRADYTRKNVENTKPKGTANEMKIVNSPYYVVRLRTRWDG